MTLSSRVAPGIRKQSRQQLQTVADILILTPWFPNRRDGWPARFVSDSALALAAEGHRVRVVVLRGRVPPGLARWIAPEHLGEICVESFSGLDAVRSERYLTLPGGILRRLKNALLDTAVARWLQSEVEARRPDVIVVHTESLAPAAVAMARALALPVLVVLHGENTNAEYLAGPGQAQRFRNALSQADRLVIVGEPLRGFAERLSGRSDHVAVVWNGVEPPARRRQVPDPDDLMLEILTVSNLQEGKGVDLLLEALAALRSTGIVNWRLRVIGSGPLEAQLRAQAVSEGIGGSVEFLGVVSNAEVFSRMAESDVFVLPSWREAFGVAYLEAMASGLLAIGVKGQGPEQFISDGVTGVLVPPRDAGALADRLRDVLSGDRSDWRAMAAAGACHVRENFTWRAHARRMDRLLQELMTAPRITPE